MQSNPSISDHPLNQSERKIVCKMGSSPNKVQKPNHTNQDYKKALNIFYTQILVPSFDASHEIKRVCTQTKFYFMLI